MVYIRNRFPVYSCVILLKKDQLANFRFQGGAI